MRIALTFDDGPNTSITPQVLDILQEQGIVASFFLIGKNITEDSAPVARRAFEMGCEINNHSLSHEKMDGMTPDEIKKEIDECTERIMAVTHTPPRFFRPPYIAVSQTLFASVPLPFICGFGCQDWMMDVTARQRIETVLGFAKDGDIVLLHDSLGNVNTVEAIRVIIPELKKRGFSFVTCGQLFDECGVAPIPNRLYSNVYQTKDRV